MSRLIRDAVSAAVIASVLALLAGLRRLAELVEDARADADPLDADDEVIEALAAFGPEAFRPARHPGERGVQAQLALLHLLGPAFARPYLAASPRPS